MAKGGGRRVRDEFMRGFRPPCIAPPLVRTCIHSELSNMRGAASLRERANASAELRPVSGSWKMAVKATTTRVPRCEGGQGTGQGTGRGHGKRQG